MSDYFSNHIIAGFEPGKYPRIHELADKSIRLNASGCKASRERCHDVMYRAHVFAAEAIQDDPKRVVLARELYPPEKYATFNHAEKCLNGMVVGFLYRQGLLPLELLSYSRSPRPYRIVRARINYELIGWPADNATLHRSTKASPLKARPVIFNQPPPNVITKEKS